MPEPATLAPVSFLNPASQYVCDPSFRNFVELAKTDAKEALTQLEMLLASSEGIRPKEARFYLLGYIAGMAAIKAFRSQDQALGEFEARLDKHWGGGYWSIKELFQ